MPPNYDFNRLLQPEEFQNFARDILQVRESGIMESYRATKDGGIDMRTKKDNKVVIGQAKRYRTYKELKSTLNAELEKLKKIKPDRYILITSVEDFSAENKQEILEKFKDYMHDAKDILGNQDLNNLLGIEEYKHVEIKYTQLYIKSANVLENVIEGSIYSSIYLEKSLKRFLRMKKHMLREIFLITVIVL